MGVEALESDNLCKIKISVKLIITFDYIQFQIFCHPMSKIVFCDFDGTITAVETFAGMLKEFAPHLSAQIMPQMYARTLTLRRGVRQLLESIPSQKYADILAYAESKPIRPGLAEFLAFLQEQSIPFIIISGGIQGMIETVLKREGLLDKVTAIYGVNLHSC